jgi:hypothetical protein
MGDLTPILTKHIHRPRLGRVFGRFRPENHPSRLQQLSHLLKVPASFFFEGTPFAFAALPEGTPKTDENAGYVDEVLALAASAMAMAKAAVAVRSIWAGASLSCVILPWVSVRFPTFRPVLFMPARQGTS